MRLTPISDPADPRVADYLNIRERDLVGRDGKFIVEGKVTLGVLVERSRFAIDSVLIAENRTGPLRDVLDQVPETVPVYVASAEVMNAIAGFDVHRGVLAIGLKGEAPSATDLLGLLDRGHEKLRLVVGIGISNHDNVGAIFRNAAAFGADAVLLDETSADPLYRKSIRVSAGTAMWLPFSRGGSGSDLLETLRTYSVEPWALTPRDDVISLYETEVPKRLGLLLGPEGPGLPDEVIGAARPIRISMAGGVDSVNVATAGAIALSWVGRT